MNYRPSLHKHYRLERHKYAPELNKLHAMQGSRTLAVIPAPGIVNLADARAQLFPKPGRTGRGLRVWVDAPGLGKTYYSGLYWQENWGQKPLEQLIETVAKIRARHNIPGTVIKFQSYMV